MVTFEHRKLIDRLTGADRHPDDTPLAQDWIRGHDHLRLLERNAAEDEIIVAALTPVSCINSFVASADHPDLHGDVRAVDEWSPNPLHHDASLYEWNWTPGAAGGVRAEPRGDNWDLPPDVYSLVFGRSIEGVPDSTYYEIPQEYTHVSGIYWRPERHAHSHIDHLGEWMDVISVSVSGGNDFKDLVSFQRHSLELHLLAMNAVLVRTFDFMLRSNSSAGFDDRGERSERMVRSGTGLYYREVVIGDHYGHLRGVQIIPPTLTPDEVAQLVRKGYIADQAESEPVEFDVYDLRNKRVATVSTDPSTTTNYFVADRNSLPFETSPAMFRPEVLTKYKADSDKYTVQEGSIACRSVWYLKNYWVNEAGQVCVYICYLRDLPYEEQRHWALHNEKPKTTAIPDRVVKTDFLGEWLNVDDLAPIGLLIHQLGQWVRDRVSWWRWATEGSPAGLTVPRTGSRDEWLDGCLILYKSVVEGFDLTAIRTRLDEVGGRYKKQERSVLLLERLLRELGLIGDTERVTALWDIHELRTAKAHAGSSKAQRFSDSALQEHGSYPAHFEDLCTRLVAELKLIEQAFDTQ